MNKQNDCQNRREAIASLILGELDSHAADKLKKHIDACQTCQHLYKMLANEEEMIQAAFKSVKDRTDTIQNKLIEQFDKQKLQPLSHGPAILRRPIGGSRIMKQITKIAAAAVIIIAVLAAIHHFGGSIDGTSVAWADVVEQINNYTKYKCRQRVVREQGPEHPTMDVYHLNLSLRRQEVEDGSIHIIDMRGTDAITVELYPDKMKATVTKLIGFGPRKDPHIIEMVKRFEQESTERLGTKEVDGKILQGFRHVPNEHNDFTVWVDPQTKLPVEIELKHPQVGQTIFLDEFEFDFELEASAFSTDIPDGYEVKTIIQDYRPVESKEITAEDIRSELNHTAYTVGKLPWIEKIIMVQTVDPLHKSGKVYLIGILSDDGNNIIIDQSNLHSDYKEAFMEWILKEQLVLETPSGAKLYTHPKSSEYARTFLESFASANPEFFDMKNLSEERFARMIVMPDGTILGLSANKQMSNEKLQEFVESLIEIKAD